jgi:hypothetical protein
LDIGVGNFERLSDKPLGYLGHFFPRQNPYDVFTYYNACAMDVENAPQSFVK